MATAAELFRLRGYTGVGMDELGQAVGVTGPALYAHFQSKNHLLVAIFERATAMVHDSIAAAATSSGTPVERLERAVSNYVKLAIRHRHLAAVYIREAHSLPIEHRARLAAARSRTSDLTVALLRDVRPDLTRQETTTRLAAVFEGLIASVAFTTNRPGPKQHDLLTRMAMAALLV